MDSSETGWDSNDAKLVQEVVEMFRNEFMAAQFLVSLADKGLPDAENVLRVCVEAARG